MAEKIISPGVFTNEIDQSFLPSAVADIGAAIIGPTLKGPAGIPTVVTSYSDFQAKFGDVVTSGSTKYQFLTSHAAEEYLKNSDTLTVVRIMDGTFGPATASVDSSTTTGTTFASASLKFVHVPSGSSTGTPNEITIGSVDFTFVSSSVGLTSTSTQIFVPTAGSDNTGTSTTSSVMEAFRDVINNSSSLHGLALSASLKTDKALVTLSGSSAGVASNLTITTGSGGEVAGYVAAGGQADGNTFTDTAVNGNGFNTQGGISGTTSTTSFVLKTIADGSIMNNAEATSGTNNILTSGSIHNIRYEVSNVNNSRGTFTLLVRAGNDNHKRKQTLETYNNVSLDPNSVNYIGRQIGDQRQTFRTDDGTSYLQLSGSYPNRSRFVTVESVNNTVDYLDENGGVRVAAASASLPTAGSGSLNGGFGGGTDGRSGFDALGNQNGDIGAAVNFYETITDSNSQGFDLSDLTNADGGSAYKEALDLLANQDEYDINLILMPGAIDEVHNAVTGKAIDVCEDRGDTFAIIDPVAYNSTLAAATARGDARDSNFAAMYWPWVKVPDSQVAGTQRWVPPSTVLGGIYAFNDRVAHPWFAPAGLNRGGITTAIQAERKLTQGNRDSLYDSNINPIATFPGQGVTVFGQKTLQKKSSALDRINVRRLLIRVKKFIASSSRFLVFEQNTAATRRRFLGIANPFLEQIQSQSGLSAFRVVMDETNNTPDTIDRNQLVGQLFLQPTRTAEFIVLDFTIQPTGASFPE